MQQGMYLGTNEAVGALVAVWRPSRGVGNGGVLLMLPSSYGLAEPWQIPPRPQLGWRVASSNDCWCCGLRDATSDSISPQRRNTCFAPARRHGPVALARLKARIWPNGGSGRHRSRHASISASQSRKDQVQPLLVRLVSGGERWRHITFRLGNLVLHLCKELGAADEALCDSGLLVRALAQGAH
eukprot:scaffold189091_cov30-Tisochrysis_lutea.AAC.2